MSLSSTISNAIRDLWDAVRTSRSQTTRLTKDVREIQRVIKRDTDLLPGVEEYGPLTYPHHTLFLRMKLDSSGLKWLGNRLMTDTVPIIEDDEDLSDYSIEEWPGSTGFFEGARVWAAFQRIDPGPPIVAIYHVYAGESMGFQAKIKGPPVVTAGTTQLFYPWRQVAGDIQDQYDDTTTINSFVFGKALQLESVAFNPSAASRQVLPVDTVVWMWWDGSSFVFNVHTEAQLTSLAEVVCQGPNMEPNPTNETYWIQLVDVLTGTPNDPNFPVVVDKDANQIVLATNTEEIQTHTHGVRVGTVVEAKSVTDAGGNVRWVFAISAAMMVMALGGQFTAFGETPVDGLAFLQADHWDKKIGPKHQIHPTNQQVDSPTDYAYFKTTHWITGTFNLDPPGGSGAAVGYPCAWWDWDIERWIGVQLRTGTTGGGGNTLFVWHTPSGDRLIAVSREQNAVREITFDPSTKTVGVIDFGWESTMGGDAPPDDMFPYDDGSGEQLLLFGHFNTGPYNNIVRWNGSNGGFSSIGETGDLIPNLIIAACLHDFDDGLGPRLVVAGLFLTMGGVSANSVARFNPSTSAWEPIGSGITNPVFPNELTSIASFNHKLWIGQRSKLWVYVNGPNADWVDAVRVVKNLAGLGLWRNKVSQGAIVPTAAEIESLAVYHDRLLVGSQANFRDLRRSTRTGPLVFYDSTNDKFHRALPVVNGTINGTLAYNGGLLVYGDFVKVLPGGVIIRNAGIWHDPGVIGQEGTWESIGEIVGPVFAAAVFNGKLHLGGDITSAGGVPVNGLARLDGTNWTRISNFLGTIRDMAVAGVRLLIVGDFVKVDGQSSLKIAVAVESDGQTLSTIFGDITATDGAPFINAIHVVGNDAFAGGWFDSIDSPAVTARSIAKMNITTGAWSALDDNDNPPTEGITNSRIVWSISDAAGLLYVGTDADATAGANGFGAGLWSWNLTTPAWTRPLTSVYWTGPTLSIGRNVAGSKVYVGVKITDGFAEQNSIYEMPAATLLGQSNDFIFDDTISGICSCDAGDGEKVYAGGGFDGVSGSVSVSAAAPAQLIAAINDDDRIEDVAGGAGVVAFDPQFVQTQSIQRLRVFQIEKSNNLLDINATTGVGTTIGPVGVLYVRGLAFDNTLKILFGITESHLFTIDMARGIATIVGMVGVQPMSGLAFDQNTGTLYSSQGSNLVSIDPSTGLGTVVGSLGIGPMVGLAFDPATDTLFGIDGKELFTINTTTGVATSVGDTGFTSLSGGTVQSGDLLSIDTTNDNLVRIDLATAATTTIGPIGTASMSSLAFDPTSSTLFGTTSGVGIACPHLVCPGFFGMVNDGYSQLVVGINVKGELTGIKGGLSGTSNNFSSAVRDAKAIPTSQWPGYWSSILDNCQPHPGFAWLLVGSFSHGFNDGITDIDLGTIEEDIECLGVLLCTSNHLYRIVPSGADPFCDLRTTAVFNGEIIVGGGRRSLQKWVGDHTSGSWAHLIDPTASGGMPDGTFIDTQYILVFEGVIWMVGTYVLNPFSNATPLFGLATWNGTAYVLVAAPGWAGVSIDNGSQGIPKGHTLVIGDLGDGEKLYAGGLPNIGGGPVIVKTGSSWAELGAGQLRGECVSLAIVEDAGGRFLIASGLLIVNSISAEFAKFDGTNWSVVGHVAAGDQALSNAAIGDSSGHAACETGSLGVRGIIGGVLKEVAATVGELGTPTATPSFGMFQYRRTQGLETMPGGGVNGMVLVIRSAQRTIWPP